MPRSEEITQVIRILEQKLPNLLAIYHFGSTNPQNLTYAHSESDIDIAYLTPPSLKHSNEQDFRLKLSIAESVETPIDLINLRTADSVIIHQVLETGSLVLNHNPKAVALWEVTEMSKYCQLNEERREILEQIRERGRIHVAK